MARQYVIRVDGQDIEVTEEVYRAYKRSMWNERSRYRFRMEHEVSMDAMRESGMELANDDALVEDIVADKIMLETLFVALQSLAERERNLIHALYVEEKTVREVAGVLGISHSSVHERKERILKKMKKNFK